MGDSELIVHIEQALWPKGVVRSLSGVLRNLGDKHGNLVIVPQPTKGHIMVKDPAEKIAEAKPGLRAIIEAHFPDADCPEELLDGAEEVLPAEAPAPEPAAASVPPRATPAPDPGLAAVPTPTPAPVAKVPSAVAADKVIIEGPPCRARKIRPPLRASPDLLWQCIQSSSCFIRPGGVNKKRFSAEPGNLMGLHSMQFSGLANDKALDIRPKKVGKKQSIELVQKPAKVELLRRPGSILVCSGLDKCKRKGLRRLDREILGMSYRPALHKLARLKYLKIRNSFKKPKKPKAFAERR